jgi:hypothetical protein
MTKAKTAWPKPDRQCVYCWNRDPRDEWTVEHVIPEAIGGDLVDGDPFELSDVCCYCNSRCGQWVDGPYIRSFLTNAQRAQVAWRHADLTIMPVVPLVFLGISSAASIPDGQVCEAWLGPGGDQIFHLHQPYPREPQNPPMIGRPVHLPIEKFDSCITFVFVAATAPWWPTVLRTVAKHFEGSELYLGNGAAPGSPYMPLPEHRQELFEEMKRYAWQPNKSVSFEFSPYYADRFEHKVALGVGALLLDPSFLTSSDARRLRGIMFCIEDEKRHELITEGIGLLEGSQELEGILRWPDAHIILVRPTPDDSALTLTLQPYGAKAAIRVISRTISHWHGRIPASGLVYVVLPGLRRHAGPISFTDYVAWNCNRDRFPNREFDQLKTYVDSLPPPPPPVR